MCRSFFGCPPIVPLRCVKEVGSDIEGVGIKARIGIGDAENDHSFLDHCECAGAVANAVPPIRELAAFTTKSDAGQGVAELIEELIANDLSGMHGRLEKNLVAIGVGPDGKPVTVPPHGLNILIAGPSGSDKSTVTAGIVEPLIEAAYQVCIVDPEG